MHASHWVHRDLSEANILLADGVGRVVDFVYAKKLDDTEEMYIVCPPSYCPIPSLIFGLWGDAQGTRPFVPIEIDRAAYLYLTPRGARKYKPVPMSVVRRMRRWINTPHLRDPAIPKPETPEPANPHISPPPPPRQPEPSIIQIQEYEAPALHYNPLHDMESLWWIAAHFVINRIIGDRSADQRSMALLETQRAYARDLFYDDDTKCRHWLMVTNYFFEPRIALLHPTIQPIAKLLDDLRRKLASAYTEAEKDTSSIDHTAADALYYEPFAETFSLISQMPEFQDVHLYPFEDFIAPSTTSLGKRRSEDSVATLEANEPDAPKTRGAVKRARIIRAQDEEGKDEPRYNLRSRAKRS